MRSLRHYETTRRTRSNRGTFPIKASTVRSKVLAEYVSVSAVLKNLNVAYNPSINGEAAQQLAAAALSSTSLKVLSEVPIKELREDKHTALDLEDKGLGPTEGIVLAELVKFSAVLTSIDLSSNQLCGLDMFGEGTYDGTGIAALAKALEVNAVLTSLDLRINNLDAEAGKALAGALEVNAVLTKLDLRYNALDDGAKRALRAAAKPGLELEL